MMKFTNFFKTTVGMKPQSEGGGGAPSVKKEKDTLRDEPHASKKDNANRGNMTKAKS